MSLVELEYSGLMSHGELLSHELGVLGGEKDLGLFMYMSGRQNVSFVKHF